MSVHVTTLGIESPIKNTDQKIDYLMCSFFFSKWSQSTLYRGRISSLSKLIQMYGNSPGEIKENIQSALQSFLAKFFTTVSIDVVVVDTGTAPGISLQIEGIVSDTDSLTGNSVSIGYSLNTKDSNLKSIINTNNGTVLYTA